MPENLRTDFADREGMISYLKDEFPHEFARSPEVSPTVGGRESAGVLLSDVNPVRYSKTRNALSGDVTRLSPYIRHGVVSTAEIRDLALEKSGWKAEKLVSELGWNDYFRRVHEQTGDRVWEDLEDWKTGFDASDYSDGMPKDLAEGETGLACMDAFSDELCRTGYLHNHARLWMAAYLVHHRRVRWQAGARWFLSHLLDGDEASNNLSWQWVASTFSAKPYFFDRGNLEYHSDGAYCRTCPLAGGGCPFDATKEELERELFPDIPESR